MLIIPNTTVNCAITYTRECNVLWGEPERVIEVCSRLSLTVEDGALSLT